MSPQTYKGNGEHKWERVTPDNDTQRLRVPGGWLYRDTSQAGSMAFVPMPDVVKHMV